MQMRRFTALVVPLVFLACGSHATPAAPSPAVLDLVPGSYAMTLTMSQSGDPVCTGGGCTAFSICIGDGGAFPARTLSTVVRLDRAGDSVSIRAEDPSATIRLDLQLTGSALGGTALGQFRDGAQQVVVAPSAGQQAAVATGIVMTASVAGRIQGQMSVGGYSCSNNGHSWTLTPRR